MTQWIPAAKPNSLSSIPKAHMVEGENQLLKLSSDVYLHTVTHTHTHF